MSGHSKWATIHRQKGIKDAARGKIFSKYARMITMAVKTGGGASPDTNFKLRDVIEKARSENMPKENIERAISKGSSGSENLEEVMYEGFGPGGISLMIEAATDNRNRTGQEIKNALEKAGGRLGGPGAVSFQFTHSGYILVEKSTDDPDAQTLLLIDSGVEDMEESSVGIECYTKPHDLYSTRKKIQEAGYKVKESELIMRPITMQKIEDMSQASKIVTFISDLNEHEDVQKIYTNADLPNEAFS